MRGHKIDDAAVAGLLGGYPDEENVRMLTEKWTVADFDYTLTRVGIHSRQAWIVPWQGLLRQLRADRAHEEGRAEERDAADQRHRQAEEANDRRHAELARRVGELKQPHWSVVPNFWLVVVSAIAAVSAAYFAWLGLRR